VKSGKLKTRTGTLAAGDALPENEPLEVQGKTTEIETESAVALVLDDATKLTMKSGKSLEPVFVLGELARVYARSIGAHRPYAIETADARLLPLGTEFVVATSSNSTKVSVLDGTVRVGVFQKRGAAQNESPLVSLDVNAAFEARVSGSKGADPLVRFDAKRAVDWLPKTLRPEKLPPRLSLVREFAFDQGQEGATKGEYVRFAGGTLPKGAVRGATVPTDYARIVEIDHPGIVKLDPNLWVEATVKVDKTTRVVLQVWDLDAKENLAFFATVEPGTWTTIGAPLRSFGDASGKPRAQPVHAGDQANCVSVFAGEPGESVELLVTNVRFSSEN
jgi:hypothetical protein